MARSEAEVEDGIPWRKAALALVVAVPAMVGSELACFAPHAVEPPPARHTEHSVEPAPTHTAFSSLDEIDVLFDPDSGESRVWYSGDLAGSPRFFTSPGFDPATGEQLRLLTREAILEIKQARGRRGEREAAQRTQAARQKALAEEAAYLARYVDPQAVAAMTSPQILLAIEDDQFERLLATALQERGQRVNTAFFKQGVFEPEMFRALSAGNRDVFAQLKLTSVEGALVLGALTIDEKPTPKHERLTTVTARLSLSVVGLGKGTSQTFTFAELGAGFDPAAAKALAYDRIIETVLRHSLITQLAR